MMELEKKEDNFLDRIFLNEYHKDNPEVKKLQNTLLSHHRFQNYILTLSNNFIKIPFSKIDDAILDSLKYFCDFYNYDHSSIWKFNDKENNITCLYKWSNNIKLNIQHGGSVITYEQVNGLFDFKNFNQPVFLRFSDYEPQDIPFSILLKKEGIKALYIFPLIDEGINIGGVVLSTQNEYKELDENIYIAGQLYCTLITSVLMRKQQDSVHNDYLQIIDGSTIASWIHDYDNNILRLSQEWKRRISSGNLSEKDLLDYMAGIIHPNDLQRVQKERKLIFEKQQVRFRHEFRIKISSGEYIWVQDQGKIIYNDDGKPSKVYGTTMDIDDSKKAIEESKAIEKALQLSQQHAYKLIDELREADKNKNEFISMLSHELRNPLATIVAGLSLITRSADKTASQSTLDIIDRQIKQLCKLVDDLLDLTRINNNKIQLRKEYTNLNTLVINTYNDLEPFFKNKNIDFVIDLQGTYNLLIDPARIKQILENLLHNALHYTDQHGKVILTVYKHDKEAVISVKDNGIGLEPDIVPFMFEPFMQAENSLDRSHGGLGLGLAIVKNIAELHGGHCYAYSEGLGKGAEFFIHLPMCFGAYINPKEVHKTKSNNKHLKILFVEDNQDFAVILSSIIKNLGHTVEYAYNSRDGLEKAENSIYDAIICDIGLPEISGYEIARRMKSGFLPGNTKLIALSGYAAKKEKHLAITSGFDYHLAKPVDIKELVEILSRI